MWEGTWAPKTEGGGSILSTPHCKIIHQRRDGECLSYFTLFLCVFRQTNVDCVVSLVVKPQSVKHVLHLRSSVWAEHVERISRLVSHRWVRLKEQKKKKKKLMYLFMRAAGLGVTEGKVKLTEMSSSSRRAVLTDSPLVS